MNTPESESFPSEASGLQVEMSAKKTRNLRLVLLLPLLIFVVVGSATLLAWLPRSSPTSSPVPSATLAQSPSTQAKIIWSQGQLEVILSLGEAASRTLTFNSSHMLQNVVIEPVPELAPFVSVQPNSFATVPASQPQSVHLTFSIPQNATLGTYDGTVHVRFGSQTLPQTLKVTVNAWNKTTLQSLDGAEISVLYPPGLIPMNAIASETKSLSFYANSRDLSEALPPVLTVRFDPLPQNLTLREWISTFGINDVDITNVTIGSRSYLRWVEVAGEGAGGATSFSTTLPNNDVVTFTTPASGVSDPQLLLIISSLGN